MNIAEDCGGAVFLYRSEKDDLRKYSVKCGEGVNTGFELNEPNPEF